MKGLRKINIYREGNYLKKGGLGQFAYFRGALAKKRGIVFSIPQCTLCAILLSMLMILFFTLNVIRHLICGNS